jgi:hypothetical protein
MKKNIIFYFGSMAMLFAGCETDLDIGNQPHQSRLVVNGLVNNSETIEIMVSKTLPVGKVSAIEFPENASVKVKDGLGNVWQCSYDLGKQKYISAHIPQAGQQYEVEVKLNGFGDAVAMLKMPDKFSNNPTIWKDSTDVDADNYPTGTLTIFIDDKAGESNYYRISLYYYDVFSAEWKTLLPTSLDADVDRNAIKADDGSIVLSDQGFDGQNRALKFITPFGYSFQTPKFLVKKESLSKDYFMFFRSLKDYQNPSGIFTEATPVFTNIRNGVGIWAGSTLVRDTIN